MIWASLLFAYVVSASDSESPALPFWKAKDKVYQRIQEERAIVVSVKTENRPDGRQALIFSGGGQMDAPQDFAYSQAMQPDHLRQAIDYVEDVQWQGERLYVRSRAFGYEAKMWFRLRTTPNSAIHFEIVQGTLVGTEGDLTFSDVQTKTGTRRTEVGISGHYDFKHFPLPKMFAEFGIEVILQRMAIHMRGFLEDLYKKQEARGNGK